MSSLTNGTDGLGTLQQLPPELRKRIYEAYFSYRAVCWDYDSASKARYMSHYERSLLRVSSAVYREASPVEHSPGFTLTIAPAGRPLLETTKPLQHLVEALYLWEGSLSEVRDWTCFDSEHFSSLKSIEVDPEWHNSEPLDLIQEETAKDALEGKFDDRVVAHVQDMWPRYPEHTGGGDLRKLPAHINLEIRWEVNFRYSHWSRRPLVSRFSPSETPG